MPHEAAAAVKDGPATVNGRVDTDLLSEHDGVVAVLRLNRPAVRNALGVEAVERLAAALTAIEEDPRVRAAILTGAPPGFCSGSDLKELAALPVSGMVRHETRTGEVVRAISRLGIPVIAAVEGFAIGGGFLLATACDIVVSARDARWHLPEARLGWVPPWGLQTLVTRVGPAAARRLAWGERPLSGQELHRLGGVDDLVAPGRALHHAREIAARLAALPPRAVASTKRALADAVAGGAEELDTRTTWMFGEDCEYGVARAGLLGFPPAPAGGSR
ncbi:enoyl-CoA hydratase/isomerase family protein [Sphaerimonospora thailandensis]|uniref:Enoyl-CoA hydratase n=1 Tax=Sphaerimonospora thailandensis TaxID=795644 RepID=A0A8J3R852_9ACTN|nr:enoyl-CoA hydratase/isomerase family protein [Sphaerimonospora thailandensis]GIH67798.1 enoyl-CoA hydratase [Sphaerimonospora thailandensis]